MAPTQLCRQRRHNFRVGEKLRELDGAIDCGIAESPSELCRQFSRHCRENLFSVCGALVLEVFLQQASARDASREAWWWSSPPPKCAGGLKGSGCAGLQAGRFRSLVGSGVPNWSKKSISDILFSVKNQSLHQDLVCSCKEEPGFILLPKTDTPRFRRSNTLGRRGRGRLG